MRGCNLYLNFEQRVRMCFYVRGLCFIGFYYYCCHSTPPQSKCHHKIHRTSDHRMYDSLEGDDELQQLLQNLPWLAVSRRTVWLQKVSPIYTVTI